MIARAIDAMRRARIEFRDVLGDMLGLPPCLMGRATLGAESVEPRDCADYAERLPRGDMPMSRVADTCHELLAARHGRVAVAFFKGLIGGRPGGRVSARDRATARVPHDANG